MNKSSSLLSFKKEESSLSEEKKQKTFVFMCRLDRAFPLRGVFSSGRPDLQG
jgi:hypothetical protein